MMKTFWAAAVVCAAAFPQAASAQVRDGVYRGTLVCGGQAMTGSQPRSAIEMTISGREVKYTRPVVEKGKTIGTESGSGTLDGDKISLAGAWRSDRMGFESAYTGSFVRRASMTLAGSQTWTQDGKTVTRACTGAAKRTPLLFRPKAR